ncbi:MAG: hypothetical protein KDA21_03540 [Phycisphaerales bacterium]|nr:hypothetical protein [Phycisphaerales bacterium]
MDPVIPRPAAVDHAATTLPPIDRAGEGPVPAVGFADQLAEAVKTAEKASAAATDPGPLPTFEIAAPEKGEMLTGAFDRLNLALVKLKDVEQRQAELYARIDRGELSPGSPEVRRAERRITTELMNLQISVQQANFGVELVSKVVEHGASGMRTVLQTQA